MAPLRPIQRRAASALTVTGGHAGAARPVAVAVVAATAAGQPLPGRNPNTDRRVATGRTWTPQLSRTVSWSDSAAAASIVGTRRSVRPIAGGGAGAGSPVPGAAAPGAGQ